MGRKKKDANIINIAELEINNTVEIDYRKLAAAIIEAQTIVDNEKIKLQITQVEDATKKRNEILGVKDYSDERRWLVKKWKEFVNSIVFFFKTIFIKKKDAQYLSGINMLFRGLIIIFFAFIRYGLYAMAVYFIWYGIANNKYVTHGVYALAAFLYAQLFRLVQFEVERMKDREYLMAIFAAIVSVLSLVISIISR